jgi:hypothetical protein
LFDDFDYARASDVERLLWEIQLITGMSDDELHEIHVIAVNHVGGTRATLEGILHLLRQDRMLQFSKGPNWFRRLYRYIERFYNWLYLWYNTNS